MLFTNPISGNMMPERNWAFLPVLYRFSFISLKSFIAFSSLANALTMLWPVYISSMCPFKSPVSSHCLAKYFLERDMISIKMIMHTGMVAKLRKVMATFIENIMISMPTIVVAAVIICVRFCCIVVLILSMSLVMRLITSPFVVRSKYESGIRESFSLTLFRIANIVFCVMTAMRYCCR